MVETLREKKKRGSLLGVLDKTRTAMGARMLRSYVEQPLIDKTEIIRRLDAVQELKEQAIFSLKKSENICLLCMIWND